MRTALTENGARGRTQARARAGIRKHCWPGTVLGSVFVLALLAGCAHRAPSAAQRRDLLLHPENPAWSQRAPDVSHLRFETSKGAFTIEVVRSWSPNGADRFYNLARLGYYDD